MFPFYRQESRGREREDDLTEIPLLVQGAPGPSPALHPHTSPTHQQQGVTHRASPVAATAPVASTPVAFVAFLRVNALLDPVSQEPAVPDFTTPTPRMSVSQINVHQFRPQ